MLTRRVLPLTVLALTALLVALPIGGAGAASYKTCKLSLSASQSFGPTYVTKLKARGISCTTAKKIVKAFHSCRYAHGGKDGTCTTRVKGYKCTETRPSSLKGPLSYDGDVTCKSGTKAVKHHYQQET